MLVIHQVIMDLMSIMGLSYMELDIGIIHGIIRIIIPGLSPGDLEFITIRGLDGVSILA